MRAPLQLGYALANEVVVKAFVDLGLDFEDVLIKNSLRPLPDVRAERRRPRNE